MPIQRLPRYVLLLGELLKYTPESSPEYSSLSSALAAIKETTEQVNSTYVVIPSKPGIDCVLYSKGHSEKANEVKRVWDILDPQPPDLLEPHRRYRQEGEVFFYEAKRKLRPRYLFLFNDVLLVTSKDNDKDKYVRVRL